MLTNIEENFRFMLIEVVKQVERTQSCLDNFDDELVESIESRDDYIDNLKSVIENLCFSQLHGSKKYDKRSLDRLRAVHIVTNNLERLADHAVNVVRQVRFLRPHTFLARYDYGPCFDEVIRALEMTHDALFKQDMSKAFKICLSEFNLDSLYKTRFDQILNEMRSGSDVNNLITTLFIFRYLERMGDALLNIGEAAIFAIIGEKFKIHQYNALRDSIAAAGKEIPISDVEFESIWGTRSGCRIGKLQQRPDGEERSQGVIFKEGNRKKLLQEKENIERWEEILPGLPPKVVALREEKESVSLLIEFLGGCTFQDVLLMADEETLKNALFIIEQTLAEIWEITKKDEEVRARPIKQTRSRMGDVFRLYPGFDLPEKRIGGAVCPSLQNLLDRAEAIDDSLHAPFSVFIHGDFNINNIVYDHENQSVHFIDLHRSRRMDYVQDISVFLVSCYRLPVFERDARMRIEAVMDSFFTFTREFALAHGDTTFQARLTLGLIRSFITSTRFELNKKFAKAMFQRGIYLLRHLISHEGPMDEFRLPRDVFRFF